MLYPKKSVLSKTYIIVRVGNGEEQCTKVITHIITEVGGEWVAKQLAEAQQL